MKTVEEFIAENIELFDDITPATIEHLYFEARQYSELGERTHELTEALLGSGENPLKYLKIVPKWYQANSRILTEQIIPDGVEEIENEAFSKCFNLCKVDIGSTVKKIHRRAFMSCYMLDDVYIRGRDTVIDPSTFQYCDDVIIHCHKDNMQVQALAHVYNFAIKLID